MARSTWKQGGNSNQIAQTLMFKFEYKRRSGGQVTNELQKVDSTLTMQLFIKVESISQI